MTFVHYSGKETDYNIYYVQLVDTTADKQYTFAEDSSGNSQPNKIAQQINVFLQVRLA